jgi:hypothetical protein
MSRDWDPFLSPRNNRFEGLAGNVWRSGPLVIMSALRRSEISRSYRWVLKEVRPSLHEACNASLKGFMVGPADRSQCFLLYGGTSHHNATVYAKAAT